MIVSTMVGYVVGWLWHGDKTNHRPDELTLAVQNAEHKLNSLEAELKQRDELLASKLDQLAKAEANTAILRQQLASVQTTDLDVIDDDILKKVTDEIPIGKPTALDQCSDDSDLSDLFASDFGVDLGAEKPVAAPTASPSPASDEPVMSLHEAFFADFDQSGNVQTPAPVAPKDDDQPEISLRDAFFNDFDENGNINIGAASTAQTQSTLEPEPEGMSLADAFFNDFDQDGNVETTAEPPTPPLSLDPEPEDTTEAELSLTDSFFSESAIEEETPPTDIETIKTVSDSSEDVASGNSTEMSLADAFFTDFTTDGQVLDGSADNRQEAMTTHVATDSGTQKPKETEKNDAEALKAAFFDDFTLEDM